MPTSCMAGCMERVAASDFNPPVRYNEFQHLMEERLENQKYKSAEVRYSLDRHRKPDTPGNSSPHGPRTWHVVHSWHVGCV